MQTITTDIVTDKNILLRMDLDVPIENGIVTEDFRLKAALPTLKLCLNNASSVIIMGHIGRPIGEDLKYSVKPIVDWLEKTFADFEFPEGKLHVLENLRFEDGEDNCNFAFAQELAKYGDFFINEAFASYHPSASTTVLPSLLPHAAGLNFAKEVEALIKVKKNPQKPFIVIMGGAKVEDKLPVITEMAKISDAVLVGGKLPQEIYQKGITLPANVLVGKLNDHQTDIDPDTTESWQRIISQAKMILWNGPLGLVEDPINDQTKYIAQAVTSSSAETILGGGDTISALDKWGMLDKFTFVSTGGGAMLKFLIDGTLKTIETLN